MDKHVKKALELARMHRLGKTAGLRKKAEDNGLYGNLTGIVKDISLLGAISVIAGGTGAGWLASKMSSPTATDMENLKGDFYSGNRSAELARQLQKLKAEREASKTKEVPKPMRLT